MTPLEYAKEKKTLDYMQKYVQDRKRMQKFDREHASEQQDRVEANEAKRHEKLEKIQKLREERSS